MRFSALFLLIWGLSVWPRPCFGECAGPLKIVPGKFEYTDDFYFTASSGEGAPGEVVGVDLSITIEEYHPDWLLGAALVAAYDPGIAQLIGDPVYSEAFWEFGGFPSFFELVESEGLGGFTIFWPAKVFKDPDPDRFLGIPIPIGTVHFRIRGAIGDKLEIAFLDDVLAGSIGCVQNCLAYNEKGTNRGKLTAYSTRHIPGVVRVVDRAPVRTDPPPLPEEARVYPERPATDTPDIHFELAWSTLKPVDPVPVDFFISSSYEFVGYVMAGRFSADHLALERIEVLTTPGAQLIDNERGEFGVLSSNSRRRMGAEAETLHAARLYFRLKEAARAKEELWISFDDFTHDPFHAHHGNSYQNRLLIRTAKGSMADLPAKTEVSPLVLAGAALPVRRLVDTPRGDLDFDGTRAFSDVVLALERLFLGGPEPRCPGAADVNLDGRLDVADPIGLVGVLFLDLPLPGGEEPARVPCR